MTKMNLDDLSKEKYIVLETYRRKGTPVRTPVWFVIDNKALYIITREKTGKVRRIRNSKVVKIAPSNFSGKPKGDLMDAEAFLVSNGESEKAIQLRNKKYGFKARLATLAAFGKGKLVVISLKLKK